MCVCVDDTYTCVLCVCIYISLIYEREYNIYIKV